MGFHKRASLVGSLVDVDAVVYIVEFVENITFCSAECSTDVVVLPSVIELAEHIEEVFGVFLRRRQCVGRSIVDVEVEHVGEVGGEVEVLPLPAQTDT